MKLLLLSTFAFLMSGSTVFANERVCGQISALVENSTLQVWIADVQSFSEKQQNFRVINPRAFNWSSGSCICVEGNAAYDPEEGHNYLYKLIKITKKVSEDDSGSSCIPLVPE